MPHVSRHKFNRKAENQLHSKFTNTLATIEKENDMSSFLNALLSPTERLMMAKRLAVVVLLEEGLLDSQISRILRVTRITIVKMKYFYQSQGKGYKVAIRKLKEQKQYDQFKKFLLSLAPK